MRHAEMVPVEDDGLECLYIVSARGWEVGYDAV